MTEVKNPLIVTGGGGGDIANAVVEEFLASGADVEAGNFVEFVISSSNTNNVISRNTVLAAEALDDERVIVFTSNSATDSSGSIYATVCQVVDGNVTAGTEASGAYAEVLTVAGTTVTFGAITCLNGNLAPVFQNAYMTYALPTLKLVRVNGGFVLSAPGYVGQSPISNMTTKTLVVLFFRVYIVYNCAFRAERRA